MYGYGKKPRVKARSVRRKAFGGGSSEFRAGYQAALDAMKRRGRGPARGRAGRRGGGGQRGGEFGELYRDDGPNLYGPMRIGYRM